MLSRRKLFGLLAAAPVAIPAIAAAAARRPCLIVNRLPRFQDAQATLNYWRSHQMESLALLPAIYPTRALSVGDTLTFSGEPKPWRVTHMSADG